MGHQYRSQSAGGEAPSGPGLDQARAGLVPDVRFIINDRPTIAGTKDASLAARYPIVAVGPGHSKGLELVAADRYGPDVQYITAGIGSSTMVDTDGDIFHKSAIEGMARDSIDLNVLLNHVPTLPWSIFGSVLETDVDFLTTHDGTEHCVLKLVTDAEKKHPEAWRTYEMIAGIDCRPRKLGYSVGCLYVSAQPRQTKSGLWQGADVYEVLPVEFSVVTMPANRLAWIQTIGTDLAEKHAWDLARKGVLPMTRDGRFVTRDFAAAQDTLERIGDWMDFGPVDGPRLERLAAFFEKTYGIVYARPRSTAHA